MTLGPSPPSPSHDLDVGEEGTDPRDGGNEEVDASAISEAGLTMEGVRGCFLVLVGTGGGTYG